MSSDGLAINLIKSLKRHRMDLELLQSLLIIKFELLRYENCCPNYELPAKRTALPVGACAQEGRFEEHNVDKPSCIMTDPMLCGATVTVRFIRSFEHRNLKNVVVKGVALSSTGAQLKELALKKLQTSSGIPPPFKKYQYDTMKIETQAFGFKTNDPLINTGNDDSLILKDDSSLESSGVKNETEISFFKMEDYVAYKKNPVVAW
ncbi:hypothetical protein FHG87_001258 [Trinorchestia longiramus]|nr:hypothetical protein FHG87_001258 [Trinorchestia longiramus]